MHINALLIKWDSPKSNIWKETLHHFLISFTILTHNASKLGKNGIYSLRAKKSSQESERREPKKKRKSPYKFNLHYYCPFFSKQAKNCIKPVPFAELFLSKNSFFSHSSFPLHFNGTKNTPLTKTSFIYTSSFLKAR